MRLCKIIKIFIINFKKKKNNKILNSQELFQTIIIKKLIKTKISKNIKIIKNMIRSIEITNVLKRNIKQKRFKINL